MSVLCVAFSLALSLSPLFIFIHEAQHMVCSPFSHTDRAS